MKHILPIIFAVYSYAANCPKVETNIKNPTEYEVQLMEHARRTCARIYPEAPCLVSFKKIADQQYRALCGE